MKFLYCAALCVVLAVASASDFENEISSLQSKGKLSSEDVELLLIAHKEELRAELEKHLNVKYTFPDELGVALQNEKSVGLLKLEPEGKKDGSDEQSLSGYLTTQEVLVEDRNFMASLNYLLRHHTIPWCGYGVELVDQNVRVVRTLDASQCLFRPEIGLRYECQGKQVLGFFSLECNEVQFYWDGSLKFSGRMDSGLVRFCERLEEEFEPDEGGNSE